MKIRIAFVLLVINLFYSESIWSQRPVLTDEETVSEMVISEMHEVFQSPDFIKKKNKKFSEVTGDMTIDITVIRSGKVATFFKVDSTIIVHELLNIENINK